MHLILGLPAWVSGERRTPQRLGADQLLSGAAKYINFKNISSYQVSHLSMSTRILFTLTSFKFCADNLKAVLLRDFLKFGSFAWFLAKFSGVPDKQSFQLAFPLTDYIVPITSVSIQGVPIGRCRKKVVRNEFT